MVYADIYSSPPNNMKTKKRQATDFIWSKNTYRLDQVIEKPGNLVLYSLQEDEPNSAFAREELMHIPDDVKVPPEWVSMWT